MKIAYVCADFGVAVFGRKGASAHVREMVRAFADGGHDVQVFAPMLHEPGTGEGEGAERTAFERRPSDGAGGIELVQVAPDPRHVGGLEELRRAEDLLGQATRLRQELRNIFFNLPLHARLMEALASEPPDFLYERYTLFATAGLRAARSLGVPHLLEVNAPLAEEQERMRGLELKSLAAATERRALRSTGAAIVVSSGLARFASGCGTPASRVHVLPNAVDPRRFAPGARATGQAAALRERLAGRCVIGFLGSLKPWHGVETLLEAFRALARQRPAAHLVVVGDGPKLAELESTVRAWRLESRVTLAGAVAHEEVPAWLSLVDIAVAPYTPHENFYFSPLKLFEYMAMGIPIVAGRIGQVEELIRDGVHGVLHAPGDADGLAAGLVSLIDDPDLRHRLGEAGRRSVIEAHTWERNAERVVGIAGALAAAGEPVGAGGRSRP